MCLGSQPAETAWMSDERIAGLRWGEAAARAVLRTAIFTRVSFTRGRNDFGKRAAAATERKESETF